MEKLEEKIGKSFLGRINSFLGKSIVSWGLFGLLSFGVSCGEEEKGCQYDTQCTLGRICVQGECVYPQEKKDVFSQEDVESEKDTKLDYLNKDLEPDFGWIPGSCICENNTVKRKSAKEGEFDFTQYCGTGGECDAENCKCAPLNCNYKCDVVDVFEFDKDGVGYKAHKCVDWNESVCGPDNGGVFLDNYEPVSVEMKASAKAQFLKVALTGRVFPEEYPCPPHGGSCEFRYNPPHRESLRITLDSLSLYTYEMKENDDCNPIILSTFDLLDPATNLKITQDEEVKVSLSLGSPKSEGAACRNYGYNPYYCDTTHIRYNYDHQCGKKTPCYGNGEFMNPELGCKYGLTRLVLTSCFYCNPETDPTCTQCAPTDPFCPCK